MKIIIEDCDQFAEDEIIIRCKKLDDSLLKLIYGLKMQNDKIPVSNQGSIAMIEPKEVYYFEAVDNKVFVYGSNETYETKKKLYELEKIYEEANFLRVSKSIIVNLTKIKSLSPAYNGRFEAYLKNGEKIIISRQYVMDLKKKLGL